MGEMESISLVGLFALALAFLAGSIPFGFLVAKMRGIDLRQSGSGNIGATNAARVLGRSWGIAIFILDFLKGLAPAIWTAQLSNEPGWLPMAAGILAILGHNFCPWLGFKGGKGIATSAGVLLALVPIPLVIVFSLWGIVLGITRIVSFSSIAACLALPLATYYFYPKQWPLMGFSLLVGLMGIWRHRPNIKRLIEGTEHRIGQKAAGRA
jgi:glycerol-3-phosphate acyltransferase PlsY